MRCEFVNSFVYIIRMIIIRWDHLKQDSHTSWISIQVIAYSKVLFNKLQSSFYLIPIFAKMHWTITARKIAHRIDEIRHDREKEIENLKKKHPSVFSFFSSLFIVITTAMR